MTFIRENINSIIMGIMYTGMIGTAVVVIGVALFS